MTSERASITVWMAGLLMLIVPLGGLGYDLARALSDREVVAGVADAAALAGAHAIDEQHLRATGEHRLDPDQARQRASASLAQHADAIDDAAITVADDRRQITVYAEREVAFTLLRLVTDQSRYTVAARASSDPRRDP
jgi:glycerate kinase